ncbi:hypothetical protein SeMB42_g06607 [Synchytrium endobioticum]|uniref:Uncharacterized protein n=1 Tax=Synchytrium endobioticum TaxID=286115 RepID=A0A507CHC2_9FUNG|nr:hypothetical protein SeMB42_g06607 [Synchytrium endobioticum]
MSYAMHSLPVAPPGMSAPPPALPPPYLLRPISPKLGAHPSSLSSRYDAPQFRPPPPLPVAVHPHPPVPPPQHHPKNANDWTFSKAEMHWTPTRLKHEDSKEAHDEPALRFGGASTIYSIGVLYQAPQDLIATAQVLYHRFYMRVTLKEADWFEHAAAMLWVAWKVEFDAPVIPKLADYIVVVLRKAERNDNLVVEMHSPVRCVSPAVPR